MSMRVPSMWNKERIIMISPKTTKNPIETSNDTEVPRNSRCFTVEVGRC